MPPAEQPMVPDATPTSYYGRPILKAPTWRWPIPAYLFSGGLAAGTALAGAGARLVGDDDLAGRATLASLGAVGASAVFLVHDLGRPARFHHMLRVAKPTSPMSVGTWILSAFGAVSGVGALATLGRPAALRRLAGPAQIGAATMAPALGTYTAVLIADTAVPAWHEARHHLPWLFAASATASGAALTSVLGATRRGHSHHRPAERALWTLTVVAAGAELAADAAMHRHLGSIATGDPAAPDLGFPARRGRGRRLTLGARAATAAGAALVALGGRRRGVATVGAAAVMVGCALQRFAIFTAGAETTRHPAYTVGPQRAGIDLTGRSL